MIRIRERDASNALQIWQNPTEAALSGWERTTTKTVSDTLYSLLRTESWCPYMISLITVSICKVRFHPAIVLCQMWHTPLFPITSYIEEEYEQAQNYKSKRKQAVKFAVGNQSEIKAFTFVLTWA